MIRSRTQRLTLLALFIFPSIIRRISRINGDRFLTQRAAKAQASRGVLKRNIDFYSYWFNLEGGLPDFRLLLKLIWPSNELGWGSKFNSILKCPDPSISGTRFTIAKMYDYGPYQSHMGESPHSPPPPSREHVSSPPVQSVLHLRNNHLGKLKEIIRLLVSGQFAAMPKIIRLTYNSFDLMIR